MATFSTQLADRVTQYSFQQVVIDGAYPSASTKFSFTVYSGSQPTATQVANEWSAYASTNSNCLAHFTVGPTWVYNATSSTYYFDNSSGACSTATIHNGTASWAIFWTRQVQQADMGLESLPETKFMVVPVTNNTGIGIFRFTSTTFVTSTTVSPWDGGFSLVYTT